MFDDCIGAALLETVVLLAVQREARRPSVQPARVAPLIANVAKIQPLWRELAPVSTVAAQEPVVSIDTKLVFMEEDRIERSVLTHFDGGRHVAAGLREVGLGQAFVEHLRRQAEEPRYGRMGISSAACTQLAHALAGAPESDRPRAVLYQQRGIAAPA